MKEENREVCTKDIIKGLKFLENEGKEVTLVNFYKGSLVKHNASILSVDENEVTFQIHKYQGLALEEEKQTMIESGIFPKFVKARLVSIDKAELKATLEGFVYVC